RFDLLGSGWVEVKHGMGCRGLEGHRYDMGSPAEADKEGKWLKGRINKANLAQSQRIWRLVDEGYTPIDWHLDFKSGYRWPEDKWHLSARYAHKPGVDIKVPWELARMQHLHQLAWAYALAKAGDTDERSGFASPQAYVREFRNQVLDFIATNPPRFGANWLCTMDAGIRVANWLIAYDLLQAYGAEFDAKFNEVFTRSIYEHGLHIINNLEWSAELRSNHYLSDIVGLLFVAAYLPRAPEVDSWLAFAVQELVNEIESQFAPDGGNFEASTSYHRLSAELVAYAAALVLGLPREKQAVLRKYDHELHRVTPLLRPAPLPLYLSPSGDRLVPFSAWHMERLERMAEFTMHIAHAGGNHIPQVGDNDSGRFLKLMPAYKRATAADVKARYLNLDGYTAVSDDSTYWVENHLDHRHLVAAINGLFVRDDFAAFAGEHQLETNIVRNLSGGVQFPSYLRPGGASAAERARVKAAMDGTRSTESTTIKARGSYFSEGTFGGNGLREGLKLYGYPDFGLYIYRSKRLYLAVRCGHIGQNGNGGHAHNDQLSIEVSIDGFPLIVDPGTYLYTPGPEKRNLFRSTAMHNTLSLVGKEQNAWLDGAGGLFFMYDQAKATTTECNELRFAGEHTGFGVAHRRTLELYEAFIGGVDECDAAGKTSLFFHLAPGVKAEPSELADAIDLYVNDLQVRLQGGPGEWTIQEGLYSPAYGVLEQSQVVQLKGTAGRIEWKIEPVEAR
ncbi:MAG: alginate lyase family protein, partial [Actinobacteria bacterium]|nr:alginate lyase family protein [Actinomycetota bacterium]